MKFRGFRDSDMDMRYGIWDTCLLGKNRIDGLTLKLRVGNI